MQPAKPLISLSIRESLKRTITVKLLTEPHLELSKLNPFKPNRVSHCYQLEQSIFVSIDVGWYFSFYSNFNRTFCKQTVETMIRRRILWHLVWNCIVCLRPTKRTLGFYGSIESCADSSESTLVKLPACWTSHVCHWSIQLIGMNIIRLPDNQSEMRFCLKLLNGTLCSFDNKVTGLIYVISYRQHDNG